ncbi:MAG TPA: hypothetical protein VEK77_11150 [Gemmatimonadales bacterium]|nr:hypothetical protein [Gemmatimonadales bacterium]
MRALSVVRGSLIAVALFAAACSDGVAPPPGPLFSAGNSGVAGSGGLLVCKPLAYDSVTKRIGWKGGSIRVSKHVLVIPDGALSQPVTITLVAPSDTVNRIQFQPEGLVFQLRASLTMSYANCNIGLTKQGRRIAYTNDSLAILEYVPSKDDPSQRKVAGQLKHFSSYALSW